VNQQGGIFAVDVVLVQGLLAGWITGAAAGLAMTALLLTMAARSPNLAQRMPFQNRLVIVGIVAANATVFVLSLVGLVLGALWHRTSSSAETSYFGFVVLGWLVAMAGLYAFVRGRVRGAEAGLVLGALGICAVAFGVALPWLAGLEQ